jgi:hypothetical protein
MNQKEFSTNIRLSAELFSTLGLMGSVSTYHSLTAPDEVKRVATEKGAHYQDIYITSLTHNAHNFILKDYSFFQFNFQAEDELRYGYYPNPYVSGNHEDDYYIDAAWEDGVDSEEISQALIESRYYCHKPLIRCEVSREQYKKFTHPASHFHFGTHGDSRWQSNVILTPLTFSLMIAKLYYPTEWNAIGAEGAKPPYINVFDEVLVKRRAECRPLPADLLNDIEMRFISFG